MLIFDERYCIGKVSLSIFVKITALQRGQIKTPKFSEVGVSVLTFNLNNVSIYANYFVKYPTKQF